MAEDAVAFIEGTTTITVIRRDWAAEHAALSARTNHPQLHSCEERHMYVDVKTCLLETVIRKRGSKYDEGVVTSIKSWSMRYTKTRSGGRNSKWEIKIHSFVVNGQEVTDAESQLAFLHAYWSASPHAKYHVFGNVLAERIASDGILKTKLYASTWTTRWLHHGLIHGSMGPMTASRAEGIRWMALGAPVNCKSLVAESRNMSALGGADHGRAERWNELELPLADFMMGARQALRRGDQTKSAARNFMWTAPTLNPLYNNKIRYCTSPFYRQLYRGLKKIDTLQVADDMTASIMY